jgi:hypothetical protein
MKMKLIDSFSIQQGESTVSRNQNYSSGNYFYALKSSSRIIKTGKFIVE